MKHYLIDIDRDTGDVFLADNTVALLPNCWAVYNDPKYGEKYVRWVVMMYDYNSPYINMPIENRKKTINDVLFGKERNVKLMDIPVVEAAKEYQSIQYDPLVENYIISGAKMKEFNEWIQGVSVEDKQAKAIAEVMIKIKDLAKSREEVKEIIMKRGDDSGSTIRGGGNLSILEQHWAGNG